MESFKRLWYELLDSDTDIEQDECFIEAILKIAIAADDPEFVVEVVSDEVLEVLIDISFWDGLPSSDRAPWVASPQSFSSWEAP